MEERIVLGCSSMEAYVAAAQERAGTRYRVVLMDRSNHSVPPTMRQLLQEALASFPPTATALIAMGFCGGSWEGVRCPCRVVIPHVDDCITLLMHTPAARGVDLKEPGHFYLVNDTQREVAPDTIYEHLRQEYGEENGPLIFAEWFRNYVSLDVVDTGFNACRTPDYQAMAARNAALIGTPWRYVPGSNLLLEKLIRGDWDEDFRIFAPGETVRSEDFLPPDALYFRYAH